MNKANRWLSASVLLLCLCGLLLIGGAFEMKRSYEQQLYEKQNELNIVNDLHRKATDKIEQLNRDLEVEKSE